MSYMNMLGYKETDKDEIFQKLLSFEIQRASSSQEFFNLVEEFFIKIGAALTKSNSNLDILLVDKSLIREKDDYSFKKCS